MIPNKTIIEEEIQNYTKEISQKFIKYEENWHNGETFKFENGSGDAKDIRYSQLKTIIENDYFIYDEIIKRKDKPVLFLKLHNDKKREILELIIYLENNKVIQQIRHLSYEQFFHEIEHDEDPIKTEETKNTTIIETPFLDFIEQINNEEQFDNNNENILEEEKQENKKWKKYCWWTVKAIAFLACIAISTTIGLVPTVVLLGIAAIKPIAVVVSIGLGFIAIPWNNIRNKIVDWVFKKKKGKYEEEIEKLKSEKEKQNKKINELKKELFLSSTPEQKQERILNGFQQIWERNKNKDFEILNQELIEKFEQNKKELEKQNFEKEYKENIKSWNKNWQEKVEFSKFLKLRHIKEIKDNFKECEENNAIICDGYFYHPKETWEEFQQEKIIENIADLFENHKKYDNLKTADIREKSPVKTMKKMGI